MNRKLALAMTALAAIVAVSRSFGADAPPTIEGCQILPADNLWNRDVSGDQIDPNSDKYVADILTGSNKFLHPDFGSVYGIPINVVPGTQAKVPIVITWADESDAGPYPVPPGAQIEGGAASTGDRHVLVLDKDNKILYEMYNAWPDGGGWRCDSAAKFDLTSNALRPDGWTSADAAGLPILPGLARYEEVAAGAITHCLRFTVRHTRSAHIAPATHHTTPDYPNAPPMGTRFRLKANFDLSGYTGQAKIVLIALKKYGMMVADNGSDWYITGAPDARWNDDDLHVLKTVPGSAFEAVLAGTPATGGGGGTGGGTGGGGSGSGSNLDSDGDGFSNELEVALGLSPTDPSSTPFGGAPAGTPQPLTVTKLATKLNFAVPGRDSIGLAGTLPVPAGFAPSGKQVVVDVGGVIESFTLDEKGRAVSTKGALKIGIKRVKKAVLAQTSKFQLKLLGSEFSKALADEGLTATETVVKQPREITVNVLFNNTLFRKLQPQTYSAKAGKSGTSK